MSGLYSLKTTTLEGKPADLSQYAGKVSLVVNVASECGYTPQYEGLEALQKEYAAKGLVVLGFPSNEFGGQEPGTAEQIRTFCSTKFHVTFPMFGKVEVKPGAGQSPVYKFLTEGGKVPNWNFCKYLVGADGRVIEFFPSAVKPESPELRKAIDAALASAHATK
ncbi:MAG: glutathione peroxidase [Armatimonadetes bacterium]|nr:glutathione peroxidase [Armatimonadota bacterium]